MNLDEPHNLLDIYTVEDHWSTTHREAIQKRIKTPLSLCGRCQNAFIFRTKRANDPTIICEQGRARQVPLDIEECNKYLPIGQLDISTLAKMATMIEREQKEKPGFHIPKVGE